MRNMLKKSFFRGKKPQKNEIFQKLSNQKSYFSTLKSKKKTSVEHLNVLLDNFFVLHVFEIFDLY